MRAKIFLPVFLLTLVSFSGIIKGQDSLSVKIGLKQRRLDDSLNAAILLKSGANFALLNQNDSAKANIQRSINIASSENFPLIEAECYKVLAVINEKQSNWEESLLNYLKASSIYSRSTLFNPEQTQLFEILAERYFRLGIYQRSSYYSERVFSLSPKDSLSQMAEAAESAANSYVYMVNDTMSAKWFGVASHYYEKSGDTTGSLRCDGKLSSIYLNLGQYDLASQIMQKSMKIYSVKSDFKNLAALCNSMGVTMFRQKEIDSALVCFLEATRLSGKTGTDNYFLTDVYSNMAICLDNLNKKKETLRSFETALEYSKKSERGEEQARIEHLLATLYFNKGDNYHAELYCLDCINSAKSSSAYSILQECYKTYSNVLEKGNDFENALKYYENYLSLRDSLNFEKRISDQNEIRRQVSFEETEQRLKLSIADQEIKGLELKNLRAESSRKENELKLLLKQSDLDRSEKARLAQSLALEQEKNQLRENEQKVRSLEFQQEIQKLTIKQKDDSARILITNNKALETDKVLKEIELKNVKLARKLALWSGALMVLVAIMILFGLISSRKKNRKLAESKKQIEQINRDLEIKNIEVVKQNEKISQQKEIIELKNQSITDSIQYASRIQAAVLPPIDFINEWGIENFILFKPKDIVSGDFYWGLKKDEKIIIAAADCTGHGVPGAFMSMLGHAFLDEIANTKKIKNAASILNMLRDEIINTLKQKGNVGESRDGMDISLLILDPKTGIIDFAGANNPLYLVRENKLIKVNGDKMPIGIHFITFTPFINQKIETKKGDHIYIFSDGFADQFGGPKGKKYMYKPFQELLSRNAGKPMELQKEILENTFIKWQGEREQVDDVLVMGIQL